MNKKIISITFLLIIVVSIALAYSYYNTTDTSEKQYDRPVETIDDNNVSEEIDNTFLEEDDEIEIGEMI